MAHSDDRQGHKSIQTTSWHQIFWTRKSYIGALHRATKPNPYWHSLKLLAMQMGYIVASPLARHGHGDIGAHCLFQPNLWLPPCASRLWTALRKFGILSAQRARVGKNIYSSQPKGTFPLSTGVSRPYLRQCQARRPRLLVFFS